MLIVIVRRPPGVFEWDNFSKGTQGVLEAVVNATKKGAVTIVGSYHVYTNYITTQFRIRLWKRPYQKQTRHMHPIDGSGDNIVIL